MKKLLTRNGFTLVELIVVIAIMSILLAIAIPFFSTADARKSEAVDYARSFYSNVQELMIDEKLAKNELPGEYTLVCAYVNKRMNDYSSIKIYMSYSGGVAFPTPKLLEDTTPYDDKVVLDNMDDYKAYEELATSLRRLLLGNERTGAYIAVVDSKYRVESAYFVNALNDSEDFETIFAAVNGSKFSENCVVNDRFAGAWPEEMASRGVVLLPG